MQLFKDDRVDVFVDREFTKLADKIVTPGQGYRRSGIYYCFDILKFEGPHAQFPDCKDRSVFDRSVFQDSIGAVNDHVLAVQFIRTYICGDANSDNTLNVADAVYIINYVFKGGPEPDPLELGDANCDGDCNDNNAAINPYYGPLEGSEEGVFDKIMEVNVKAPWLLSNMVLPHMKAQGGGSIINITSPAATRARTTQKRVFSDK